MPVSSNSTIKERGDFRIDLFNLCNILNKYADSKRVFKNYFNGKSRMEAEHRELLDFERKAVCNAVMNCLVTKVTHLRPHDFIYIFHEIQDIFPLEMMGLYYMPPYSYQDHNEKDETVEGDECATQKKNKKKQVVAKGQLLTCFRYRMEKFKTEKKLLEEVTCEHKSKKPSILPSGAASVLLDYKLWLSENFEPWEIVEDKWMKTCSLRASEIEGAEDFKKLIMEWPRYTRKFAYTLIDIDFNYAFAGKNLFKGLWPKFRQNIIKSALDVAQKSERDKLKNKDFIKKMQRFEGVLDEEGNFEGFTAIHALFFLLPNKNKACTQKLSKLLLNAKKGEKVSTLYSFLNTIFKSKYMNF